RLPSRLSQRSSGRRSGKSASRTGARAPWPHRCASCPPWTLAGNLGLTFVFSFSSALGRGDIETGVVPTDDRGQAFEIVAPAAGVVGHSVVGQPAVHEADKRLVAIGDQSDLDLRGAGRNRMARLVPPEREDDSLVWNDLDELARRRVSTLDQDPMGTPHPGVQLRLRAHP